MGTWFDRANCRGLPADLFFPERGTSTRHAKAICKACDVSAECLAYGLTLREAERPVGGVWGGRSERERRLLKTGKPKNSAPWYERNPDHATIALDMAARGATAAEIGKAVGVGKQAILNWRARTRLGGLRDTNEGQVAS